MTNGVLVCDCEPSGTNPAALTTCDVLTGQCSCKDRVIARNCSECISGYWGLTADNALGCNECACNPQGTKGNTNMCDKTDGSCECKVNVAGDLCEQCKPNTFNFDPNNPEGCTECECDPGASVSETCELVGGQCTCRSAQLNGRECNTPVTGYYVPKLDFAVFEPETAANGNNIVLRPGDGDLGATVSGRGLVTLSPANQVTMDFTFSLPFTGLVDVVVRFEKTTADKIVYMLGKLTYTGTTGYQCQGQTVAAGQEWSLLSTDERDSVRDTYY
ncbi:laminin subunit beta-1 [Aplysia californica]|uniref:Laminin subunit beta-1 n=1 Tax=Aplysia californica TaxID=6500 RepID=A0ABM0JQG1_APLCA|nr:laminin subunit beta-1 [Aplysia californica]